MTEKPLSNAELLECEDEIARRVADAFALTILTEAFLDLATGFGRVDRVAAMRLLKAIEKQGAARLPAFQKTGIKGSKKAATLVAGCMRDIMQEATIRIARNDG